MAATERELMAARIFTRAVFPVMKVVLNDVPSMKKKFENVKAGSSSSRTTMPRRSARVWCLTTGTFSVEQGVTDNAGYHLLASRQ